jgi:hypothetical protein
MLNIILNFILSVTVDLPKREPSQRKAKENCSNRWNQQEKLLDDEEDESAKLEDINFSDSDDDASWTPFKEKGASSPTGK